MNTITFQKIILLMGIGLGLMTTVCPRDSRATALIAAHSRKSPAAVDTRLQDLAHPEQLDEVVLALENPQHTKAKELVYKIALDPFLAGKAIDPVKLAQLQSAIAHENAQLPTSLRDSLQVVLSDVKALTSAAKPSWWSRYGRTLLYAVGALGGTAAIAVLAYAIKNRSNMSTGDQAISSTPTQTPAPAGTPSPEVTKPKKTKTPSAEKLRKGEEKHATALAARKQKKDKDAVTYAAQREASKEKKTKKAEKASQKLAAAKEAEEKRRAEAIQKQEEAARLAEEATRKRLAEEEAARKAAAGSSDFPPATPPVVDTTVAPDASTSTGDHVAGIAPEPVPLITTPTSPTPTVASPVADGTPVIVPAVTTPQTAPGDAPSNDDADAEEPSAGSDAGSSLTAEKARKEQEERDAAARLAASAPASSTTSTPSRPKPAAATTPSSAKAKTPKTPQSADDFVKGIAPQKMSGKNALTPANKASLQASKDVAALKRTAGSLFNSVRPGDRAGLVNAITARYNELISAHQ